jgi:hypothetical protein
MDEPHAVRDSSDLSGRSMQIHLSGGGVKRIDVFDEAEATFVEDSDSTTGEMSGNSNLSGDNITFYFKDDQVRKISAVGAAQSQYYPSPDDTTDAGENLVSGDTIYIYVEKRRISKAEIRGGAEGLYITKGSRSDDAPDDTLTLAHKERPDTAAGDTLIPIRPEIVAGDSSGMVSTDSLLAGDSIAAPITPEDTIKYQGGFLEYFAAHRIIRITGDAEVRQGEVSLDAEEIEYDIPKRVVVARARIDTVDTNVQVRPLAIKDGSEEIMGTMLVFNVDSKRGKIEDATTQYENAYYGGEDLYKEEEEVFYVEDGHLTSCDQEEPHFHFQSQNMKLIHNDRVIARPVTLYIETLPVITIPYYVFPLKRGRHSGILPLRLGNFEEGNRFIGNIGYYWAASEYWDIQSSLDFHENIGITINNVFRYNKRYTFTGNLHASYSRDRQESAYSVYSRDRWRIYGSHNQTLPYEVDLRASGEFVSDKNYTTDYSNDPDERRNRNVTSKANLNKRFGQSSLSLSFNHTDNLDTDSRNSSLPTGSFSMPSFHPFGSGKEIDGEVIKKWYNELYVGYRNSFGIISNSGQVITADTLEDSSIVEYENRSWKDYGYLDHSFTASASQKIFKYVSIGPNLSLYETWYYILKSDQADSAGIPQDRPYRRASISAGISSNTNLYGTFNINQFGLMGLRHVLSPSAGFSWSPTITKNDAVRRYTGRGGGGSSQKRLNFGLQNLLQAKIKTGETERKLDLLRVNSALSYNIEAETRKFSNLTTSLSSTLIKSVNVRGSLSHTLYDQNDELIWQTPSLQSFSISGSFQARGSVADDYVRQGINPDFQIDSMSLLPQSELTTDLGTLEPGRKPGSTTDWNVNLSYYYSETKFYGDVTGRTHWLQYTFNLGLTEHWDLKFSHKYDFISHESIDKVVDLYRRMHCWEAHFYWIPEGSRKGYYFKVNVISIPDIKVERSQSGIRGALL